MRQMILREFTKYVSLNVLGMIGLSAYILADTFFVAKALGANGITALNFCISIFSIIQGVGLMLGIGGATRYALTRESGDVEEGNRIVWHALMMGLGGATVFIGIGIFGVTPLAKLLGADTTTLPLATVYLRTILIMSPFFLINNILLAFIRNDDNPKLAMTAMLVSSLSNIILDYIFLFQMGLGMFGAAFATSLAPIISLMILSAHFITKKNQFKIKRYKIIRKKCKDITLLGFSAFISELASGIALIVFNLVILQMEGNIGVAAYGIIANIALVATAVFTGVAQGIQPLASRYHGVGDSKSVRKILGYTIMTAVGLAVLIYLVISLGTNEIVAAFNNEDNPILAGLATKGIRIYFIGCFFAGINIVVSAFLSAIDHPREGMITSLLRSCILLIPMVLICSMLFKIEGTWLSFVLTECVVSICGGMFLMQIYKRK